MLQYFMGRHDFCICLFQSGDGGSSRVTSGSGSSSGRRTGEEPHIGKYRLLKTIGKGNFAKVKLAKHIPTGKEVRVSKPAVCCCILTSFFTRQSFPSNSAIQCSSHNLNARHRNMLLFVVVNFVMEKFFNSNF